MQIKQELNLEFQDILNKFLYIYLNEIIFNQIQYKLTNLRNLHHYMQSQWFDKLVKVK